MTHRKKLMVRSLTGGANELSADEQKELQALLSADENAREEFLNMNELVSVVSTSARRSFGPNFADRVVEQLARRVESRFPSFADLLAPLFYRVAGAGLALTLAIGAYNVVVVSGTDQTPLEAALGLPSVTVEAAYESALGSLALNVEPDGADGSNR